ncbi:MAG: adenylyltransferase/cytidyltransferase family protein [Chthoniobacterales bacterium]|nr:adenylyltransferase/cytidyltransferase family protein [Chthoniobacterales bacterium]
MNRLLSLTQLAALGEKLRHERQRIVFTNGCFDLLHVGHVRYLEQARDQGDLLVVAINSDRSVRSLKGPERPFNHEKDRAEVVAALRCVDYVTIFDDLRTTAVIEVLRPTIYVKGGDYTIETLDPQERAALESCRTEIVLVSLIPGRSTTALASNIAASLS